MSGIELTGHAAKADVQQLMAIFGWLSLQEAERYTRAAKRKKMAGEAMGMLVRKDG